MTYPLGKDPLEGKPCETCPDYATNCAVGCTREGDGHNPVQSSNGGTPSAATTGYADRNYEEGTQ
jgi:hypothetical protein